MAAKRSSRRISLILSVCVAAFALWQSSQAAESEHPKPSAADEQALPTQRHVDGVRIVDQRGGLVHEGRVELGETLARIAAGERYPHRNDGGVFQNRPAPGKREGALPKRTQGYYREYVHPTPGLSGPGPQRIVRGQGGEWYYTPDHYNSFVRLE